MLALRDASAGPHSPHMKLVWKVGEVIRKERTQRRWKQAQLANKAGISVSAVIRLEREGDKSEQGTIDRVAKALGVPLSSLHQQVEYLNLYAGLTEGQQARVMELARQFAERTAANRPPGDQSISTTPVKASESEPPAQVRRRK